jgi:hypothetical protein
MYYSKYRMLNLWVTCVLEYMKEIGFGEFGTQTCFIATGRKSVTSVNPP